MLSGFYLLVCHVAFTAGRGLVTEGSRIKQITQMASEYDYIYCILIKVGKSSLGSMRPESHYHILGPLNIFFCKALSFYGRDASVWPLCHIGEVLQWQLTFWDFLPSAFRILADHWWFFPVSMETVSPQIAHFGGAKRALGRALVFQTFSMSEWWRQPCSWEPSE